MKRPVDNTELVKTKRQGNSYEEKNKKMLVGIGFGLGFGLLFGTMLENLILGLLIGVAFGILFGIGIAKGKEK